MSFIVIKMMSQNKHSNGVFMQNKCLNSEKSVHKIHIYFKFKIKLNIWSIK